MAKKSNDFFTTLHIKTLMELDNTLAEVKKLQTALGNIGNGKGKDTKQYAQITTSIQKITDAYTQLQRLAAVGFSNEKEVNDYVRSCERIQAEFDHIYTSAKTLNNSLKHTFDPTVIADEAKKLKELNSAFENFKNSLNTKIGNSIEDGFDGVLKSIDKALAKEENYLDLIQKEVKYRKQANAEAKQDSLSKYGQESAKDLKKNIGNREGNMINKAVVDAQLRESKRTGNKISIGTSMFTNEGMDSRVIKSVIISAVQNKIDETIGKGLQLNLKDILNAILQRFTENGWELNGKTGKNLLSNIVDSLTIQNEAFFDNLQAINSIFGDVKEHYEDLDEQVSKLAALAKERTSELIEENEPLNTKYKNDIKTSQKRLNTLESGNNKEEQERFNNLIDKSAIKNADTMDKSIKNIVEEFKTAVPAVRAFSDLFSQVKEWVKQFISLLGALDGVKNIIHLAFETVLQLDESFASIAMVTNYNVSDLWAQYDQYAEMATQLGVSTNDAIQSSALFYQQGMSTNEALKSTVNTLTLARLAGEDYATATDQMTAAMQAYDMTSSDSIHVTDAWSELAAKTAADVGDIATAFSKVGSLAQDAGMDFDTLSAYLAETKEVTLEAPKQLKFRLMYA